MHAPLVVARKSASKRRNGTGSEIRNCALSRSRSHACVVGNVTIRIRGGGSVNLVLNLSVRKTKPWQIGKRPADRISKSQRRNIDGGSKFYKLAVAESSVTRTSFHSNYVTNYDNEWLDSLVPYPN